MFVLRIQALFVYLILVVSPVTYAAEQPLTITPTIVAPGLTLTASGNGFQAGARAVIWGGGPYTENFIAMADGVAYVTGAFGHLYTLNRFTGSSGEMTVHSLVDPGNPVVVNALGADSGGNHMHIRSTRAYVTDDEGLKIYDLSQPGSPALLGSVTLPGNTHWVTVVGDYAYITATPPSSSPFVSKFHTVDISNPAMPLHVGVQ